MIINWLSHSFFKIETQGNIIAIDPFNEEAVGVKPSRFKADIVLSSHDHDDHNNIDLIMGEPFVLKNSGEIEINNIFVKAIETFHDNKEGEELGKNNIFVIDTEGMRLVHMGDYGERKMKDDLIEKLGSVDILLIPVGNDKIMSISEAIDIIKKIEPKIVIPMHYQTQGPKNNEEIIKKFIKEIGMEAETMDKLNIKKANLSDDEDAQMQLIILQN